MWREIFRILTFVIFIFAPATSFAEVKISYYDITNGRLAFTYIVGESRSIYVLDFGTLDVKPLPNGSDKDEYPVWSPDGSKLLFQSNRFGKSAIFVANADGSDLKPLTNGQTEDQEPAWSPDGTRIVFRRASSPTAQVLFTMNADGSQQTQLSSSNKIHSTPHWSPNGSEIIFTSSEYWPGTDLIIYDFKAKKFNVLTHGSRSYLRPAWHPTGTSFVYSFGSATELDIWQQKRAETKGEVLISRAGKEYDAEWKEDGKNLFFVGETENGNNHYEVFLFKTETREIAQVTNSQGSVRYLSWTPTDSPKKPEIAVTTSSTPNEKTKGTDESK